MTDDELSAAIGLKEKIKELDRFIVCASVLDVKNEAFVLLAAYDTRIPLLTKTMRCKIPDSIMEVLREAAKYEREKLNEELWAM